MHKSHHQHQISINEVTSLFLQLVVGHASDSVRAIGWAFSGWRTYIILPLNAAVCFLWFGFVVIE